MNISLQLYPTGVPQDIRYLITIHNDTLTVINYSPRNPTDIRFSKKKLKAEQIKTLTKMTKSIKTRVLNKTSNILDTWGASLQINNVVFYEDADFSIDNANSKFKSMIKFIFEISPIKIELYDFS